MAGERRGRIKLKDIAEMTGYTVGTVSKALQNKEGISEGTRNAIARAAREHGYIANTQAGGLRSGSTKTVAVIISDIANPLFSILIKSAVSALEERGYSAIVMDTQEKPEREERAIKSAISKNVDGVILCPTQLSDAGITLLRQNGTPFVLVGRRFDDLDADCVIWNDRFGACEAVKHLIGLGHRDILILMGHSYISSARDRLLGCRDAFADVGLPLRDSMVCEIDVAAQETTKALQWMRKSQTRFTAVLAFSDMVAWEAISAMNEMGLRVPQDVSVTGFDDVQSQLPFPCPLTTVHVPKTRTARQAVELLLERIESDIRKHRQILLNTRLVIRGTTAAPRGTR